MRSSSGTVVCMSDANELLDAQIENQGIGVVSVKDGTIFKFTSQILKKLLDASTKSGEAIVFLRHQRPS